ncbi:hypothetical protein JAAARDRAFT_67157 [Jaapia argillacea MUCL 33604]|uniref:Uncharacterized protein n=1 Tax=Jaapia argillacea MUCL 33604 TaxID=933084 RepID=A0A067QB35_9AGAM|nr:hypothetical protein JAAARDRAFT_67157 [Jaapia argillacea MUCL 33604]
MHNPVIVVRFVFFALLVYLNVLTLVASAINIGVTKSSGISVPGASVFVLVNSCLFFVAVVGAFAELVTTRIKSAQVAVECSWTLILSVLQLAASLDVTVNGPPLFCRADAPVAVCASSYLLMPTTWLASVTLLAYFFSLVIISVVHMHSHQGIWWSSIYQVAWFTPPSRSPLQPIPRSRQSHSPNYANRNPSWVPSWIDPLSATSGGQEDKTRPFTIDLQIPRALPTDVEKQPRSTGPILFHRQSRVEHVERPEWANQAQTRRGLDAPFAVVRNNTPTPPPPPVPPKTYYPHPTSSDSDSNSSHHTVTFGAVDKGKRRQYAKSGESEWRSMFPQGVQNEDEPIPLPSLSEWMRVESGIENRTVSGSRTGPR